MNAKFLFPLIAVVLFVLSRCPGLLNFSALYALAFCAGAFPRRLPWWTFFGALLLSDMILNVFVYYEDPIHGYMLVNYLGFGLIFLLGKGFSKKTSWLKLVGGGILGALIFYLITNTASWITNPQYPKTIAGWLQALTTGIPGYPPSWMFFRNTLISGGLFTALLSAFLKWIPLPEPEEQEEEQPEEEPTGTPEEA